MIRLIRKYLLGGKSDKREGAWLIFFIITGVMVYSVIREAEGVPMANTWAFLTVAWPGSVVGVIGVHAQHFYEQTRQHRETEQLL